MRTAVVAAALALAGTPVFAGGPKTVEAPDRILSVPTLDLPAVAAQRDVQALDLHNEILPDLPRASALPIPAEYEAELHAERASKDAADGRVEEAAPSRPLEALRRFIGLGERDAVEKVSAALAGMPAVRVYFSKAPGFGHQSATLAAARRLRELGFHGKIQGIYGPSVEEKMGVLAPGFDAQGAAVQEIPALGMTLESHEHFEARPASERPPVPLALTGGNDSDGKSTSKLAWLLNAETFLNLQPLGWRGRPNEVYFNNGKKKVLRAARLLPFIYQPAQASQLDDAYFDALRRQPSQAPAKVEGLRALTRRLEQHDLLAAYGLAFFKADTLHRLLLGVSAAMDRRPDLFQRRGVVIPLLLDVPDMVQSVKGIDDASDWVTGHAEIRSRRLARVAAAHDGLQDKLQFARIDDPDLARRLDSLQRGQILLLETGPVPPAVFETLFRASTLPPTLEGKNAVTLARLLGKPFLGIGKNTRGDAFDAGIGRLAVPLRAALRRIGLRSYGGRRLTRASDALELEGRYAFERIAAFIVDAKKDGSRLMDWFARRRLRQDDYRKDKLVQVLKGVLR